MSNAMSAEGARAMAADLDEDCYSGPDEYEIAVTLRAYADMLDRQTVDREAVIDALKAFRAIVRNEADQEGDPAHFADRILALMPAGNPNVAHLKHAKDGMVMVPREPTEEMVNAGCAVTCRECHMDCDRGPTGKIYRAMIEAAQGEWNEADLFV